MLIQIDMGRAEEGLVEPRELLEKRFRDKTQIKQEHQNRLRTAHQGPVTLMNLKRNQTTSNGCVLRAGATGDDEVSSTLRQFWEIKSLGIKDSMTNSAHHESVLQNFEETITMEDGRYEVVFPWKFQILRDFGNTRKVAEKRLQGLCRRWLETKDLF
ncbi:hypothetical protein HPB47_022946 [Ixodes persulcatus]|uniref:Uncharacterized protein n=1 Tax=Ixodes persulcatus TaxID=34615 RepID=A0AC60QBH7_IXOPE|nr:hypothetical protein HPB47_022946 [Ixodes persulcatus]